MEIERKAVEAFFFLLLPWPGLRAAFGFADVGWVLCRFGGPGSIICRAALLGILVSEIVIHSFPFHFPFSHCTL